MTERSSGSAQENARRAHLALAETPANSNGQRILVKRKREKLNRGSPADSECCGSSSSGSTIELKMPLSIDLRTWVGKLAKRHLIF